MHTRRTRRRSSSTLQCSSPSSSTLRYSSTTSQHWSFTRTLLDAARATLLERERAVVDALLDAGERTLVRACKAALSASLELGHASVRVRYVRDGYVEFEHAGTSALDASDAYVHAALSSLRARAPRTLALFAAALRHELGAECRVAYVVHAPTHHAIELDWTDAAAALVTTRHARRRAQCASTARGLNDAESGPSAEYCIVGGGTRS